MLVVYIFFISFVNSQLIPSSKKRRRLKKDGRFVNNIGNNIFSSNDVDDDVALPLSKNESLNENADGDDKMVLN